MKGAAALWIVSIIGLGFSALVWIIVDLVYNTHVQNAVSGLYTTQSVLTNIQLIGLVIKALPWALTFFFIAFLISQGQKEFREGA
jgi:type IV secretory pathway protease TraF